MDINTGVKLDFSNEFPFITVDNNATLQFQNLTVTGMYDKYSPDLAPLVSKWPRPLGFELWPAIIPMNGSTIILSNMMLYAYAQKPCTEDYLRQVTYNQASVLGGYNITGYIPEINATWVTGYHELPMSLQGPPDQPNPGGIMTIANGTAWGCLYKPEQGQGQYAWGGGEDQQQQANNFAAGQAQLAASSSTSNEGLSVGVWIGIGIGIAAAVLAAGLLINYGISHRKWKRSNNKKPIIMLPQSGSLPSTPSPKPDDENPTQQVRAFDLAVDRINAGHAELTIATALKIRFGSLDGLEIGNLIGRGAHGRIYKGSMRGTPVAVKVVDHCIDPGGTAEAAAGDIASEVVLLTALAHPNIVRVFRVATIKLEDRSSSFMSSGRFSDNTITNAVAEATDIEMGLNSSNNASNRGTRSSPSSPYKKNNNGAVAPGGRYGSSIDLNRNDSQRYSSGSPGGSSSTGESEPKNVLRTNGPGLYETWMVMEFCEKGSLYDAIQRRRFRHRDGSPNQVKHMAEKMAFSGFQRAVTVFNTFI